MFVNFIGNSRSGHTLIAQVLNAHKDIAIGNEVKAVKQYRNGKTFNSVRNAIIDNTVDFANNGCVWPPKKGNWNNRNYDFKLYQGKTSEPKIIGDKYGPSVIDLIKCHSAFERWVSMPVCYIHVYRDRVKTIQAMSSMANISLAAAETRYDNILLNCAVIPSHNVNFDKFMIDPLEGIKKLFNYLKIELDQEHIKGYKEYFAQSIC